MQLQKYWLCIITTLLLAGLESAAQNNQDEVIRKTIHDETAAFVRKDVEAWKATWLQDDKTSRINTNSSGSFMKTGWNNVSAGLLKYLKENPKPDSVSISTDSFSIRTEGNMSVVDYKQNIAFLGEPQPFDKGASREQRVLVKKNGKWLIAASTSTDITELGTNGEELTFNSIGYNYLFAGKNEQAIKVFELNTFLFPNSFNVWDSLGEAYAKAGNKDKAIECYEKSMAINPASQSGKKALAELK